MNTVMPAVHREERAHEHTTSPPVARPRATTRVSTLDRLAMRAGLALLVWSRRRGSVDYRLDARNQFERHRAREQRERAAQREHLLLAVLR